MQWHQSAAICISFFWPGSVSRPSQVECHQGVISSFSSSTVSFCFFLLSRPSSIPGSLLLKTQINLLDMWSGLIGSLYEASVDTGPRKALRSSAQPRFFPGRDLVTLVKVSSAAELSFPEVTREILECPNHRNGLFVTKLLIHYSWATQVPNRVHCVH